VLSHLHGDHWDRRATKHLDHALPVVTTPHAARRLQGLYGFRRATGIRNWESQTLFKDGSTLQVTSLPGMHAPGPLGMLLPPVMGSLLEFGDAGGDIEQRVYLTGDTLMYDGIREIARRCPDIDLAVVHLGGTRLPGGMIVTMDGEQGVQLLQTVMPRRAVPVHYDDYDVFSSPLSDFTRCVAERGLEKHVIAVERGQTVELGTELGMPHR
jgi:L-ascorbate metabolism protein UlaG (beta-lactamase superfamily)